MRALPLHDGVVVAREIALGALELDHARAGIGQLAGCERRGDRLVEREDEGAGERLRHAGSIRTVLVGGPLSPFFFRWGEG